MNGVFQVTQLAHGTDGSTNGTATFTSAAGNFQASMVGLTIRINTKGAYIISAVASATSITLSDPAGAAVAPTTTTGTLVYDVGPESPYRIASVDSNTQLTLIRAWSGPTLTGVSYQTWQDIRYTADITGQNTDGIGGIVRITGSDNDQTATRANCVILNTFGYRTFQGFTLGETTSNVFSLGANITNYILEDLVINSPVNSFINGAGGNVTALTVRRCLIGPSRSLIVNIFSSGLIDNAAILFENLVLLGSENFIFRFDRTGGVLIRNCLLTASTLTVRISTALTVGQAITVNNSLVFANGIGFQATANSEIIEDYNSVVGNTTDRTLVTVGQHSNAFLPIFQPLPLSANGRVEPWLPYALLAGSGLDDIVGLNPPSTDIYGTPRPQKTKGSWGPVQSLPLAVTNLNAGTNEYEIPGRGYIDFLIPILTGLTYTITAGVRWDNNANIGVKPSMTLLADYGVAETSVSAVGTGALETLTISSITPTINTAEPGGVMCLRLLNNSTFASVINTYFSSVGVV